MADAQPPTSSAPSPPSTPPGSGAAVTPTPTTPAAQAETPRKQEWAPRMWEGCNFFAWMKLLFRNRFAVQLPYLYIAVIVTIVSFFHTMLRLLQEAIYGRRIPRTPFQHAPIFIVGHWRTGTTYLHELLVLDERHSFPTYYECLEPNHFLLTEKLFTKYLNFLLPSRRPMDNMKVGWDRPQEDEFALCMLGQPSPYLSIAFPNRPAQYMEYLDFDGVPPSRIRRWKRAFLRFLQEVNFVNPKRLVLKSPPHSSRIKVLRELFPDALFVHIVRDPYVVFPSTVNLWKSLYRTHGLQTPNFQGLDEQVYTTFLRLYDKLEEGKKLIDPGKFYELRYEDLVADPRKELAKMYDHFQLGGFNDFLPRLDAYLADVKDYKTNRFQLSPEKQAEITQRWRTVIERYGYPIRCS